MDHWIDFPTEADDSEYNLEQTILHEEYQQLVEVVILRFLKRKGFSMETFLDRIREELDQEQEGEEKQGGKAEKGRSAGRILRVLARASDFILWASDMKKAHQDQKDFWDVD